MTDMLIFFLSKCEKKSELIFHCIKTIYYWCLLRINPD